MADSERTETARGEPDRAGMTGKTVVITGCNAGIGKQTAKVIAGRGATVAMVCRDPARGEAARDEIRAAAGHDDVRLHLADLGDPEAIRAVAAELLGAYPRIDVLLNNAGAWIKDRRIAASGLEMQLAVNHLGPFLLTHLLRERLVESAPARVVTVASGGHWFGWINFDNLQGERFYNGWLQYCHTKLMNVLFTRELARRLEGTGVTANCVHPGPVNSNFAREGVPRVARDLAGLVMLTVEQGAETSVHVACSPAVEGVTGTYFVKSKPARTSARARDDRLAARLWSTSEQLCGLAAEPAG